MLRLLKLGFWSTLNGIISLLVALGCGEAVVCEAALSTVGLGGFSSVLVWRSLAIHHSTVQVGEAIENHPNIYFC